MYAARFTVLTLTGIFFGFLANLLVVIYVSDYYKSWRILTNTVLIPTVPLLVMIYLMPESPRYLMKHGRYRKALEAFEQIQTTSLLASRDFMYAHAQLDFESRLFKGDTNEYGTLAERIDASTTSLSSGLAAPLAHDSQVHRSSSRASISPSQSIRSPRNEMALGPDSIAQPRDSHQQSSLYGDQSRGRNINPATLGRRESDLSSLDIEFGIERAKKKDNPYSYHIGVTSYFKRLVQLGGNKRCRRALLSASVSMISQQMTGVNTIAFLGLFLMS